MTQRRGTDGDPITGLLTLCTVLAVPVALAMAFFYAPRDSIMGDVQRIFYFHVASAWVGFAAFAVTAVCGALYLGKVAPRWDRLGRCSARLGLAFITMAVITGSLWARPTWGTYWTWEPRLTISAVQLFVYLAYGMLRQLVPDAGRGARLAAVYGLLAFVTVPLSWFAIRWWRTIHPQVLSGGGMAMEPAMVATLMAALAAFSLLYLTLLRLNLALEADAGEVSALRAAVSRRTMPQAGDLGARDLLSEGED